MVQHARRHDEAHLGQVRDALAPRQAHELAEAQRAVAAPPPPVAHLGADGLVQAEADGAQLQRTLILGPPAPASSARPCSRAGLDRLDIHHQESLSAKTGQKP